MNSPSDPLVPTSPPCPECNAWPGRWSPVSGHFHTIYPVGLPVGIMMIQAFIPTQDGVAGSINAMLTIRSEMLPFS